MAIPPVRENIDNVVFTGTLTPSSPRAVVLDIQTRDGILSGEIGAAVAGEDYDDTSDVVRFEPGVTEEMFVIPLINDFMPECFPMESFDVQIALDLQFSNNNRAFIAGGLNGGTFTRVTGIIMDDDGAELRQTPAAGICLEVLLPLETDITQISDLLLEVWVHDLDDSPFDMTDRDSDQVDTATRLLDRTAARDLQLSGEITDRLLFELNLLNGVTAGSNLVFSVLAFPTNESALPTLIARQGNFDLPDDFGQTISMAFGPAEIVAFGNATVDESMPNAVFLGSITPSSPRAVVLNLVTQDGTSPQFDAAQEGEDYTATSGVVRFEAGEVEETIAIPILDDELSEPTETFDVLLELDISFASNNRAYLANGLNGGTFSQVTGTITDEDNAMLLPPPDTGIRLEVLPPLEMDIAQVNDLFLEVWVHDLDDSPFDMTDRDSDQVDTATQLLNRTAARDLQSDVITDRLLFDIDLRNGVTDGNRLAFSVLAFPANDSDLPTFIARQGNFDLPDDFGQTISMAFGPAEIVAFDNATTDESMPNAVFLGSITPSSPRAVVLNLVTQDGTSPQFDAAREGEDYTATSGVVRFEAGEVEETIAIPILDDDVAERTETFDVLLELDISSASNNRAFIAGGLNGGTFTRVMGIIMDDDSTELPQPPAAGIRLEVLLPLETDITQIRDLLLEVWVHDLDDSPFDITDRDSDQVDTATRLLDRTAARDLQLSDEITDRLLFDLDLLNGVTAGSNLVFSVLAFPTNASVLPTLIARQGNFDLPDDFGRTISMAFGPAEIVAFGNTTVDESMPNAVFLGSITPSSPRAVVLNLVTQDGTSPQFDAAQESEDYTATNGVVRFGAGEVEKTIGHPHY